MEVRELRNLLDDLDDDAMVVLASDSEGNSYRPLTEYNHHDYFVQLEDYEYVLKEVKDGDKPCLVLWPS